VSGEPQHWIVRIGQRESKPLSSAQLKQLAEAGRILPATPVRLASSDRWVSARQIRTLFDGPATKPATPVLTDEQALAVLASRPTTRPAEPAARSFGPMTQPGSSERQLSTRVSAVDGPKPVVIAPPDGLAAQDDADEYGLAELPEDPHNAFAPRVRQPGVVSAELTGTRSCPYCGEAVRVVAKKCRHCGEWLDKGQRMLRELAGSVRDRCSREVAPHRGGTILGLALFGIFCFGIILGPMACAMASHDLREMAAGRMDSDGQGLTRAGQICGMIVTALSLLGMFVMLSGGIGR